MLIKRKLFSRNWKSFLSKILVGILSTTSHLRNEFSDDILFCKHKIRIVLRYYKIQNLLTFHILQTIPRFFAVKVRSLYQNQEAWMRGDRPGRDFYFLQKIFSAELPKLKATRCIPSSDHRPCLWHRTQWLKNIRIQ